MTELLLGTKKGLFALEGDPTPAIRGDARGRSPASRSISRCATRRSGRAIATMTSPFYGPKIWYADDPSGEWMQAEGVALPEGGEAALERIWVIVPGEGGCCTRAATPACCSRAATAARPGRSTRRCGSTGSARTGSPAAAGCACTRSCRGRASPTGWRSRCRRPACGSPRTTAGRGGGATAGSSRATCPRRPARTRYSCASTAWSARARGRSGCSSSSTAASTAPTTPARPGARSASGLPSDFGFPLALDPSDPDSAYVIPLDRRLRPGHARRPRAGVRDARRRGDAGRRAATACPSRDAYLTVLRRAFDRAGEGSALQLYFGATSGEVFGSGDAGATWFTAATHLPPVFSVTTTG